MDSKSLMEKTFKILIYSGWGFILFSAVYDLFIFPARSLIWFGSLLIFVYIYFKFEHLPKYIHFLVLIIVILNILGELFLELYYVKNCNGSCINPYYDKILHFINPIILCSLVYHLAKKKIGDKNMLLLFSVCVVFALGGVWEIIEYIFDNALGGLYQGVFLVGKEQHFFAAGLILNKFEDTMLDLVLNLGGVVTFWIIGLISTKRD
jgi:uncharacterized membrane protein YjdF